MEKLKPYFYLTLGLLSVFLLGAYSSASIHTDKVIESHQWVLTSIFGISFMYLFIKSIKK